MSLSCILIAGTLWIKLPHGDMIQPEYLYKPQHENQLVINEKQYPLDGFQYANMTTEEWVTECIAFGYSMADPYSFDDIDINERTGVDDQ